MNPGVLPLLIAGGGSLLLALPVRAWAAKRGLVTAAKRLPATGGVALAAAWWLALALAGFPLEPRATIGLALAMVPLFAVGLWDVRRPLGPLPQLLAQFAAALGAVLVGGIAARTLTNPFGGLLSLAQWEVLGIAIPGALLTIAWIVLLMNTVNFLDGTDGLAAAVSLVGFLTIGAVSLLPQVNEPAVALPAFLAAAATAGILYWNLPPARLYLGTTGPWFLGLLLAVLSVQGSSKIATLGVVGAIPLLDAVSVIVARVRRGQSPLRGDTMHFHHRLAARGWTPLSILGAYAAASATLAAAAVYLPTSGKVALLTTCFLAVVFLSLRRPVS